MDLELVLLVMSVVSLGLGIWSIWWARSDYRQRREGYFSVIEGHNGRLYIGTLLLLGATILVAAFAHADGLAPIGLLAGILLVGMLWETPAAVQDQSVRVVNDSIA